MQEAITERRPRGSQDAYKETCREALILQAHDHMDVGGRTMSGTIVEDAQEQ